MATNYDTNMLLRIRSSRCGGMYECHRFTEYDLDFDLEADADSFRYTFSNPATLKGTINDTDYGISRVGLYTGLFTRFDRCEISLNSVPVLSGMVDRVGYHWDKSSSNIDIEGRGLSSLLVDNDATPATLNNVKPNDYIQGRCSAFGLKYTGNTTAPVVKKLDINTGESEISIMRDIINVNRDKLWFEYNTVYTGRWAVDAAPLYLFTRGLSDHHKRGMPIESLDINEGGGDTIRSKISIYGSTSNGTEKIVGKFENEYMVSAGISRIGTQSISGDATQSQYINNAKIDADELLRESYTMTVTTKTPSNIVVLPNRTCQVIDVYTMTNAVMFITHVKYTKSIEGGSTMTVDMVPSDGCLYAIKNSFGTKYGGLVGIYTDDPSTIFDRKKG